MKAETFHRVDESSFLLPYDGNIKNERQENQMKHLDYTPAQQRGPPSSVFDLYHDNLIVLLKEKMS